MSVANVTATLALPQLIVGQTISATATTKAAAGSTFSGRTITWQSNDPSVATVAGGGPSAVVTAVGAGTTT